MGIIYIFSNLIKLYLILVFYWKLHFNFLKKEMKDNSQEISEQKRRAMFEDTRSSGVALEVGGRVYVTCPSGEEYFITKWFSIACKWR